MVKAIREYKSENMILESASFSAAPRGRKPDVLRVFWRVTANFAMVRKFEESAKESTRGFVKCVMLLSSTLELADAAARGRSADH